ncbi:MAG TPA: GlsB/YeaQ/YmgE family stress response membrane protein [Croceibacterium sp.]|jgi:uncharacterized membrane protein YeaQ/YmgE (transglycosylase-associated protein family)
MGFLFMIVVGAILGWLVAIILRIEAPRGVLLNIAGGIAGALLAGLFIAPLFGNASLLGDNYSVGTLLLSLVGSIVVIAALNMFYGARLR